MAKYDAPSFGIELPADAIDATVYAFAFPQGRPFTPTLSVRIERHAAPMALGEYADGQLRLLGASVDALAPLRRRTAVWHGRDALDLLIEWGPPDGRIRQRLVYVDAKGEPQIVYILTATDTAETFDDNDALFNRAILSFLPKPAS